MKRILFISPQFYTYSNEIKKEMIRQGYEVTYLPETKINNYVRLISRFLKKTHIKYQNKYFKTEINKLEKDYEVVFIIRGENLSKKTMDLLKNKFSTAKFIMYQWDSMANLKNFENIKNYFNKILTFDDIDAKNNFLEFQPLFYLPDFKKEIKEIKEYDLYCVLDNHSDRYKILMNLSEQLKNNKIFFYLRASIIDQILYILTKKEITPGINLKQCKFAYFKPLKKEKNIEYMNKSKAILDIQFENQNGLTIRTIETLITKTKLITTNTNVEKYEFYNSNNILIINRENPIIDLEFFNKPYIELSSEIYDKYSLSKWIKKVLE